MGVLNDFVKNFRETVRDLNDKATVKEKELRRSVDEQAKNVTPESVMYEAELSPFLKNVNNAFNGTLFDDTSDENAAMMYNNPYPITADDAARLEPYRQQFYDFFDEYSSEADPIKRMIIIDKYGYGPLGKSPLTGEILQDMSLTERYYAQEKKQNPYYKDNARVYRNMFDGQLNLYKPRRS